MQTTKSVIRRALVSVADKTGLVDFLSALQHLNIEFIATGNTAKLLKSNNIPVVDVSDVTHFPEMLDGRVKTLHPNIHAGILARRHCDLETLAEHDIQPIDLVIVNLYPFAETIAKPDCQFDQAIEQIDIGGPTLLRAAAKNHCDVTVVVDPNDYPRIVTELQAHGNTGADTRHHLAAKVFHHTAAYDRTIAHYFDPSMSTQQADFKEEKSLRYGENPHQSAALHPQASDHSSLGQATPLQGKALSYNNLIDADAALACVRHWSAEQACCAIIKHCTPCGVALGDTLLQAYNKALSCDPVSAFGGIVALNQTIEAPLADALKQQFVEVLIAPGITPEAQAILSKKKNLRIMICDTAATNSATQLRSIDGGILSQAADSSQLRLQDCQVVTKLAPTNGQRKDLWFAWQVVQEVKSNAIVYAQDGMTLGVGSGQTSRVFSAEIAALKAAAVNFSLESAVMASDAFFPFPDSIQIAASKGIRAVIQPGGSKRDAEVIQAADDLGVAMLFTGERHFKH